MMPGFAPQKRWSISIENNFSCFFYLSEVNISAQRQSRRMSALEALFSVFLGYVLTVLMQYALYAPFGIRIPMADT